MHKGYKIIYWMPRILGIVFAAFISLFAFDVFGEHGAGWEVIAGFLIHLIPTFILCLFLGLAWKWEWIGALMFFIFGAYYLVMTRLRFDWVTYLVISGPMFLISILFLINWLWRKRIEHY